MDERKCTDCTYFNCYYVKQKTRFFKTGKGFCFNTKVRGKKATKACDFYVKTDSESEKQQRLKYLKDYLEKIAKNLEDLKAVLADE